MAVTVTLIPLALTSQAQMERIYSDTAVDVRSDDVAAGDTTTDLFNEIINFASTTIFSYTLSHYLSADLVNVRWVSMRAAYLACYYLSRRRADAPQFVDEVRRIIEELELVRDGKLMIPDDNGFPVPQNAATIPAISSFRIDDRYLVNKQRVVKSQSTEPYAGQPFYQLPGLGGESY